jgi:multidrug resistance efflux pump
MVLDEEDSVSYRKESVDNLFSASDKPFKVMSPPRLGIYAILAVMFLLFIFVALYFISLPTHIKANGEVLAGKDYYQIRIPDPGFNVSELHVLGGQKVVKGQALLTLRDSDENKINRRLEDMRIQLTRLEASASETQNEFTLNSKNAETKIEYQLVIIARIKNNLMTEEDVLTRTIDNVNSGLVSRKWQDDQKRIVLRVKQELAETRARLADLYILKTSLQTEYQKKQKNIQEKISRMFLNIDALKTGTLMQSPCDCIVENLLVDVDIPVSQGQSALTLSTANERYEIVLFIPSSQFRDISVGNRIRVNVESYPTSTYGATTALIDSVSSLPVPNQMLASKGMRLNEGAYFVVKASVVNVPDNVTLITGMTINSDIVIDDKSLLRLIFDFFY